MLPLYSDAETPGGTLNGINAAFTLLFATLHIAAMRNEILRRRVRSMLMLRARAHEA